ncbi:MAG: hypothetical protein AB7O98_13805 [Hyphomonadaceae bacterium]
MRARQVTPSLKARLRSRGERYIFWSLGIAALASAASVVQAIVLLMQGSLPYRAAIYERQLEAGGAYYAAAHEQWVTINDLADACEAGASDANFAALVERFTSDSAALHRAYADTIASFPRRLHDKLTDVWDDNEYVSANIVRGSANCGVFLTHYRTAKGSEYADSIQDNARLVISELRRTLQVDTLSWTPPEAASGGAHASVTLEQVPKPTRIEDATDPEPSN